MVLRMEIEELALRDTNWALDGKPAVVDSDFPGFRWVKVAKSDSLCYTIAMGM